MTFLMEAVQIELGALEGWPEDAQLYQPLQDGQMTLPDQANCLSAKTFLNMCQLKYEIKQCHNAEEISPSGNLPFIKVGTFLTAEYQPIVNFVQARGIQLSSKLSDQDKASLKAYISLVETSLGNAELYLSWLVSDISKEVTFPRYASVHPWPLTFILPRIKRMKVKTQLQAAKWADKTTAQVCEQVNSACKGLSERLGQQQYFFGDQPTELDAAVFGHTYSLLHSDLPNVDIKSTIIQYSNLVLFCDHVEQTFFHPLVN